MSQKIDDYGDILNTKEVKEILGIGFNKAYDLLQSGEIKSFYIGRERKIPKECLKEYIKKQINGDLL